MISRILSRFSTVKQTCLRELHVSSKAKMVEFAGYELPVLYVGQGIIKEHLHCRENAAIFDVSHMGQIVVSGPDRIKLLQRSTVGSTVRNSRPGLSQCYLTMFLNEQGGIIDDAIANINEQTQQVRIVVNGANKYTVMTHLLAVIAHQKYNVKIDHLQQNGLIALQGPKSAEVLASTMNVPDLSSVPFMTHFLGKFNGQQYTITRSGYTGEDGFEIASNGPNIASITHALLKHPAAALAGLGARDSLRLEAGLCLHGHDISPSTTPFEGTLMWTVYKRKAGDNRLKFIGQDALAKQQADVKAKVLTVRKRVGFMVTEAGVVREHCKVFNKEGVEVGETCSGVPSPSLKKSVGMAYVHQDYTAQNTELYAEQRGRKLAIAVRKMPFVPSNYYKRWNQ